VLIIYTGGTMGMTKQDGALAPKRGFLPEVIAAMPETEDELMPSIDILEYETILDSSNVGPAEWVMLAKQVQEHYYDYDGFVVIHGTDTLAYTASALSFMLENLGKPVVLTGSMIPMGEVYNDARRNLIISLVFAAQLELPEVVLFFNDRLLRGCRARKLHSTGLDAFDSPNFPPLATVGTAIHLERANFRKTPSDRLKVQHRIA
jgi:L-asparaginase